jgi:RHH-type rel operon transcriptional repressor/antitoxin RelB
MTISVRLSDQDTELFKTYAAMHNISLSDLIRTAVIEKIEDEYDLKCYEEAIAEYNNNPTTYTLEDVEREIGL